MNFAVLSLAFAALAGEPRLIWSGPEVTLLGGPSRDGKYFSYVHDGELAVRDLAGGKSRRLTRTQPGSKEFAYFSSVSPDSKYVAYAWFNAQGFYDLRLIPLAGGEPRILYSNEQAGFVQPCAWSPDGSHILTLLFRKDNISQIVLLPVAGGPPRILRSLNWVYPKRMDWSPDGRGIVYDSFKAQGDAERGIFLLSADGGTETPLVMGPGNHLFPLWMPGGGHIVFTSDRGGSMDAWILPVSNGERAGVARRLRGNLGRFLPLGISAAGDYFYGVRTGLTDVFVTALDGMTANARRATIHYPGRNSSPAWSPDGTKLAYLSRRGSENFGQEARSLVIRTFSPDTERDIPVPLAHIERVRWASDGTHLLLSGSDSKARAGLYRLEESTARLSPLFIEAGANYKGFEGVDVKGTVYHISAAGNLRQGKTPLHTGPGLLHLAASPDGKWLAASSSESIVTVPVAGGAGRTIALSGVTALEWGTELVASTGAGLWRVPLDGSPPQRLNSPDNLLPGGFSLHPDGKRIAIGAGKSGAEIWSMRLSIPE